MKKHVLLLVVLLLITAVLPAYAIDCMEIYGYHIIIQIESKQATCTEEGYEIIGCARDGCNYRETLSSYDKIPHDFVNGVCILCGTHDLAYSTDAENTTDPVSSADLEPSTEPEPTTEQEPATEPEPPTEQEPATEPEVANDPEPATDPGPVTEPEVANDPEPATDPESEEVPAPIVPTPAPAETALPTEVPIAPLPEDSATPEPVPTETVPPTEAPAPTPVRASSASNGSPKKKEPVWDLEISFSLPGTEEQLLFLTKKTGSPQKAEDPADPYQYEATLSYLSDGTEPMTFLQGRCWFSAAVHGEKEDENLFRLTITQFPQLVITLESSTVSVSFLPDTDQSISLLLRILGLTVTDSPFITIELPGTDYAP